MNFRAAGSGEAYKPPVRLPNAVKTGKTIQSEAAASLSAAPVVPRKRTFRTDYFDDDDEEEKDEEKEEGDEEWRGRNAVPRLGNEAADVSKELEQVGEGDEVDPLDGS